MTEGLEITGLDYLVLMRNDQGHVRGNLDEKKIQHFTKTRKSSFFLGGGGVKKKQNFKQKMVVSPTTLCYVWVFPM